MSTAPVTPKPSAQGAAERTTSQPPGRSLLVRRGLLWLTALVVVAFGVYRIKFRPSLAAVHTVLTGEVHGEVMGTGTLEARIKTTISPRIQERLAEVLVDQGDAVKAGQLLARLDDAELKQQVAVAEAALGSARATVERVRADESRARAVIQQAQLDHKRVGDLMATKVASQSDFDKAVESLLLAEADLKRSQATIVEAESQVFTAEKSLLYRREQLAFTELRSPYDGLITRRDRDPGGVVMPGGSLLQLIATNEIWISAWVDETAMSTLATNQTARVVFRSEPARSFVGELARLGREADRETREFLVDVRVRQLPSNWTVGQRAEVLIETGRRSGVVIIPAPFVVWREGKPGTFVNDHGRARWRDLALGLRGAQTLEVVQGLSAGEQIIRPLAVRQGPLSEGQRVSTP
ncbi:MAG: efflux RND transporter periplasmic adaptor subunit [Verrucomicrobiales bacterium]|nr:efflux RND transporter periplasmic adaptor subunit [Verrucomicrobiales bacterium]